MHIVRDTETSGFSQNRLLQLGAILADETDNFRPTMEISLLVRPDEWEIEPGATAVHGITNEHARTYGLPIEVVLGVFAGMCQSATTIVGHNDDFDKKVMDEELRRAKWPMINRPHFCTMKHMLPICRLPASEKKRKAGFGGYKKPKLMEAYFHAFGEEFDDAHGAIEDARATARLYRWIKCGGRPQMPQSGSPSPDLWEAPTQGDSYKVFVDAGVVQPQPQFHHDHDCVMTNCSNPNRCNADGKCHGRYSNGEPLAVWSPPPFPS